MPTRTVALDWRTISTLEVAMIPAVGSFTNQVFQIPKATEPAEKLRKSFSWKSPSIEYSLRGSRE